MGTKAIRSRTCQSLAGKVGQGDIVKKQYVGLTQHDKRFTDYVLWCVAMKLEPADQETWAREVRSISESNIR